MLQTKILSKKNPIRLIVIGFFLFTLNSCKRDEVISVEPKEANCTEYTQCSGSVIMVLDGPIQRSSPCFNPNNSNEFVFIERDTKNVKHLFVYNLQTRKKQLVLNSTNFISELNWGVNNWIVFKDGADKNLYKIRPDGTNRTFVYNFNGLSQVAITVNQEIFCCSQFVSGTTYKIDFDGNLLDSFPNCIYDYGDFSPSFEKQQLACYDYAIPYHQSSISIKKISSLGTFFTYIPYEAKYRNWRYRSLSWHPNCDEIYYASYLDIQKISVTNYTHTIVRRGCPFDYFGVVRVSPDGTKLLTESIHDYYDSNCRKYSNSDIAIMNIDGTEMKYPLQ